MRKVKPITSDKEVKDRLEALLLDLKEVLDYSVKNDIEWNISSEDDFNPYIYSYTKNLKLSAITKTTQL